ncbi:menaquinone biosynthetic enzyme MqnA/MqnD family protein [Oleidesulfovibrio sp.]|uniref:menaquinone biosynthetic enzyme MqnA/MqnD family protein n=1 Tax=Oleidesulfovibrio sp. TaxID=2909707 RepID=UPI003A8A9A07
MSAAEAEKRVRLGRISYLNVLPIYYPLEAGQISHEYELVYGPPAELNRLMAAGNLDVASTSSIEYARNADQYYLAPDLAIGSCGPVMSVLLLSQRPVEELEGQTILTTSQSHTSAALLRLLLRYRYGLNVEYRTGSASEQIASENPPEALLAIGDEALRLRNHPMYPYRVDMGEAWREWTGLPFIFGVWVVSRDSVARGRFSTDPATMLQRARDWSAAHMETILDIGEERGYLNREDLVEYFRGLVFTLGEEAQQGLRTFYQKLVEAGELERMPELVFYDHTVHSRQTAPDN